MKKIILPIIFMLIVAGTCFAESGKKESLSITTYNPSPNAVYRNIKLTPSSEPPQGSSLNGTIYYNSTVLTPYIYYNSTWNVIGREPFSYNIASPANCAGTISNDIWNDGQLCSQPWYQVVEFNPPFHKKPHVMVFPVEIPHHANSSCARNSTEGYVAYPENISNSNFTLRAGGNVWNWEDGGDSDDQCNNASKPNKYNNYWTRAMVKWFAVVASND